MLRIDTLVLFTHKSEGCRGQSSTTEQGTEEICKLNCLFKRETGCLRLK